MDVIVDYTTIISLMATGAIAGAALILWLDR